MLLSWACLVDDLSGLGRRGPESRYLEAGGKIMAQQAPVRNDAAPLMLRRLGGAMSCSAVHTIRRTIRHTRD